LRASTEERPCTMKQLFNTLPRRQLWPTALIAMLRNASGQSNGGKQVAPRKPRRRGPVLAQANSLGAEDGQGGVESLNGRHEVPARAAYPGP
jgi:hypothetical protein